jgi:DNA-binding transcriptional MocR family regulator
LSGEIPDGQRLPSERQLAERLGVNRTTVLNALEQLKSEGLVDARVGSGTVVRRVGGEERGDETAGSASARSANTGSAPVWNQLFSQYAVRFESGLVKELLALASRADVISFATGIAAPDSGPVEILRGLEAALLRKENTRALLHSPTEGFLSLRAELCRLMQERGVFCHPEEVMMLAGSQQGIDLAARIFLDPGDIVVIEEPTYFPAIQVFKTAGARIMTVPVDADGMRVDILEQLLGRFRPKLIYTNPTYHNPTGSVLSVERRQKLVALAARHNVVVLEDDAYGDLCYEGSQPSLLKALDRDGHVMYLSTFSKNVYSGLRLGWMVADRKIIQKFSFAKQLVDLHSSSLSQWMIERFVADGGMTAHLSKICVEYAARRDLMLSALNHHAPEGMSWTRPSGGYYVWCRLPEGLSANDLVAKAAEYHVAFIPGGPFFHSGQGDGFIRLNFTYAPKEKIEDGVRLLCKAVKALVTETTSVGGETAADINPIV